jgi:salicylate hydroxylase
VAEKQIIIAGAGIAGLAAALAGWQRDVLVLEKTTAFEPVGAGLQLGPNAVSALQTLGVWDAVAPVANCPPEIHLRDGLSGKLLKRLKLGEAFEKKFGAPYRTAHRADLHRALLGAVSQQKRVEIRCGEEVQSAANNANDCTAILNDGAREEAAALIAADGVHSVLRQNLFAGTAPIDSGTSYHRALLATWPSLSGLAMDCINVWMLPHGHVVHYPVGHPQKLNLVAVTPKGARPQEAFEHATEAVRALVAQIENQTPWPGLYIDPLQQWNVRNVLLLGDAAHGTLPYLAQGAAMSLEDAAALHRALRSNDGITSAFSKVNAVRIARTKRLHLATLATGRSYHMTGLKSRARNMVLRALPEAMLWRQLNWLYANRS